LIKFKVRLIPENAEDFFNPIEKWINDYFKNPAEINKTILQALNTNL
jgi:hypothetical protein